MLELVGYAAALLTSPAFLPQVVKTWRSRSTGDLSFGMLLAQSTGVALWIVYGIEIGSTPVIVSNACTLSLTGMLLAFKLTYRPRSR